MFKFEGADAINKETALVKTAGKKLDMRIHVLAMSVANHINIHHEISLMENLFDAMPKGSRVNALKAWFLKYAKVDFDDATKTWSPKRSDAMDLTEANDDPWFDFKKEPEFSLPDVDKGIAKMIKTVETALQNPKCKGDDKAKLTDRLAKLQVFQTTLDCSN